MLPEARRVLKGVDDVDDSRGLFFLETAPNRGEARRGEAERSLLALACASAAVALRWINQQGVVVATSPGSNREYAVEDLAIGDFTLTDDEMAALDRHESEPAETYSFTCDCARAGGAVPQREPARPLPAARAR